jgi:hypothetical protein
LLTYWIGWVLLGARACRQSTHTGRYKGIAKHFLSGGAAFAAAMKNHHKKKKKKKINKK